MASERNDRFGDTAVRLLINFSALGLCVGTVAIIVATIIVEID